MSLLPLHMQLNVIKTMQGQLQVFARDHSIFGSMKGQSRFSVPSDLVRAVYGVTYLCLSATMSSRLRALPAAVAY